jgi:hypothetical protein
MAQDTSHGLGGEKAGVLINPSTGAELPLQLSPATKIAMCQTAPRALLILGEFRQNSSFLATDL